MTQRLQLIYDYDPASPFSRRPVKTRVLLKTVPKIITNTRLIDEKFS